MGIWQDVVLSVSDQLQLGDLQVVTHLPLPDVSTAEVEIVVPRPQPLAANRAGDNPRQL